MRSMRKESERASEKKKITLNVMMNANDYSNIHDVHSCHNIKVYMRDPSVCPVDEKQKRFSPLPVYMYC